MQNYYYTFHQNTITKKGVILGGYYVKIEANSALEAEMVFNEHFSIPNTGIPRNYKDVFTSLEFQKNEIGQYHPKGEFCSISVKKTLKGMRAELKKHEAEIEVLHKKCWVLRENMAKLAIEGGVE